MSVMNGYKTTFLASLAVASVLLSATLAMSETTAARGAPDRATWSEADCQGEWRFADLDRDDLLASHEAALYFNSTPLAGYSELSRSQFMAACKNGTLSKAVTSGNLG